MVQARRVWTPKRAHMVDKAYRAVVSFVGEVNGEVNVLRVELWR